MSSMCDPFPAKQTVNMTYATNLLLQSDGTDASKVGASSAFRLNCIYDPLVGTGDRSAYGYAEMAQIYGRSKVLGVFVDIEATDTTTDGAVLVSRIIPPNTSASIVGGLPSELSTSPMTLIRFLNDSGRQTVSYKEYLPIEKAATITKLMLDADITNGYSPIMGTSPTQVPILELGVANQRAVQVIVSVNVRLTYRVLLYDRRRLPESSFSVASQAPNSSPNSQQKPAQAPASAHGVASLWTRSH